MNILTLVDDLNATFPKFDEVYGLVEWETAAPLYGRGSIKFDQSQVQYVGRGFPYTPAVNSWQGFHFKASSIKACGLVQWLTVTSARGDLRFNESTRKLEARVNGTLVTTSSQIFNADTLYHLQLFLSVNGAYQWIQVKIDDKPLLVINYFANVGTDPANYNRLRWGPFLGGGSGILLLDDLVVNDGLAQTGGDYGWPGRIVITDEGPIATGANILNQFAATGAQSVPTATDELDQDEDITFGHTETNRRRHAIKFATPAQPSGGILEAVGFDVIPRVTTLPSGSEDLSAKLKLRFRVPSSQVNEVQTITIANGEAGDQFQFGYELETSPLLDFDAPIVDVQVEADAIFGETGVVVSGTPGEEYIFTFAEHWSQTRMLMMTVGGVFGGSVSGSISVARSMAGSGIYEVGEPFGYIPPIEELPDDSITDAYPEALSTFYESRTARRRVHPGGGSWNRSNASIIELVIRADLPFFLLPEFGGADDEQLPLGAADGLAVVNEGAINGFGINVGTGAEGSPLEEPPPEEDPPVEIPYSPPSGGLDFRLLPGSPAIGAGTPVPEVTVDFRGRPRDPDNPTIGAFEGEY